MKITNQILSAFFIAAIFIFSGCDKEDDDHDHFGTLQIEFEHKWGPAFGPFSLNTEMTHPSTGEKMTFTTLKYYVSNIVLVNENGTEWVQPESYYIVDAVTSAASKIKLENVPTGNYTGFRYTIGVDSTRNVSGAQEGALSPSNNLFWSWSTGYIFIKAEGNSPDAPAPGDWFYHIGGFSGANNAIRTNNVDFFNSQLRIKEDHQSEIHMKVNAARFWHGGLSLNDYHTIHMPGANALTMADNFQGAIVFDHIHN